MEPVRAKRKLPMDKPWPEHSRFAVWAGFVLVLLLAPLVFSSSLGHNLLSQMGIAIIACLSYNILLGQGGMLSFGHTVYTGMGSFLAIHSLKLAGLGLPLPVSLVPIVGGLASLVLSLLLGWVTTRKSGTSFAMITLGMGELVWAVSLLFPQFFGGEGGVSGNRVVGAPTLGLSYGPQIELYYLIALYTLVCTALMYAFTRTPLGRMLNAVRDNPQRAEFIGYDARKLRYFAFAVAAFFAGIAGGLAALNFEIVTTEVLSGYRSGAYLLFTVLGGTTFFAGPILGAVLMVLCFVLLSELTRAWLLYVGLVFLFMLMLAPGGIASLVAMNLRIAFMGRLKPLLGLYLALAVALLVTLAGATAMVEMAYHLQLNAALGSRMVFMGLPLDTSNLLSWLASTLLMLLGLAMFEPLRRRFVRRWNAIQQDLANDQRPGGKD